MDLFQQLFDTDLKSLINKTQNDNLMATLCITGVTATLLAIFLLKSSSAGKSKKGKKKKLKKQNMKVAKKPLTLEEKIEKVLGTYNTEYRDGINKLLETFDKSEKQVYEKNYFNEMLLKLLIELDGVDLMDISDPERKTALKLRRKEAIKLIQGELNKLDNLSQ
ncbi:hypothetical protein TPHA_0C04430 [Tetrapisispora phaffii CBS 4417]|uniref:BAG domain-containing protein n=1 Tax=Tetrapisispora phaffii (strain ATCC 24235 / CBS 4417 / NBRC 1672 / NRRL Y-8282 / UCD 70-5) TaxID=1071381 RepID=G8BQT1_TETPH|nr:hypothetical protein TPHA_0C04430 [Tetrapisispora phaffii CBS 4417]CCE62593.1 hypothetical protein TPHA_0C04430 [Tetrapisispora phaffii CBS 4417]